MTAHARAHRALAESLTLDAIERTRRDLLAAGDRMLARRVAELEAARAAAFPTAPRLPALRTAP